MSIDPNRFGVVGAVTPLLLLGICRGGGLGFDFPTFTQQFLNFRPDPQGHCLFFPTRCIPLPLAGTFVGTSAAFSVSGTTAARAGAAAGEPSVFECSVLLSSGEFSTLEATASGASSGWFASAAQFSHAPLASIAKDTLIRFFFKTLNLTSTHDLVDAS